jgi:hypothetical protein
MAAVQEAIAELCAKLDPARRHRTCPRKTKRSKPGNARKRMTDLNVTHNGPPKIHIFNVPITS